LLNEDETIQTLKSISQGDFQQVSSTLLEKMGFTISSSETRDESVLFEGEIERGGKVREYLIKCTRAEENLREEIKELHELLGGKKYGLFLTTSLRDRGVEKTERIEFVGGTPFYKLLKKFDILSQVESHWEELSEEEGTEESTEETSSDRSEDIEGWGKKGKEKYKEGEYREAIRYFEKVIEVNPEDHVALNNKALCHLKEGDHEKALESINEAISIHPDFEDAYLNKAYILEKKGEVERAKDTIKKLIELKPSEAEYHYIYAAYWRKIDELQKAWKSTQKALELEPEHDNAKKLSSILRSELKEEVGKEPEELEKIEVEKDLKDQIQNLEKENEELKEELDEKESEIAELEEEKRKVENKFEMEKNRLRNTIKLKQERIDSLQEKRNELKEALEEVEGEEKEEAEDEDKEEEDIETKEEVIKELQSLKYVGPELADRIYESGYKSIDDLKEASEEELGEIKGMGSAITKKVFEYLQEN